MNDPQRLIGSANEFERDLLASWKSEAPSTEAKRRVLALAGGAAGVALAGAAASKLAGTSIAPKAIGAGAIAFKWLLAIAIAVSLAAAAVAVYLTSRTIAPPARALSMTSILTSRMTVAASAPEEAAPTATPTPTDAEPGVEASAAPAAPRSAVRVQTPEPTASAEEPPRLAGRRNLSAQIASIDRARDALRSGDAAEALRRVDAYEHDFPGGILAQEATMLRLEALLRQGKRAEAQRLADRLLASNPTSPYAARVRALLSDPSKPSNP